MFLNMLNDCKFVKLNNSNAAATTNFNSAMTAIAGYNSALFLVDMGGNTAGAVVTVSALTGSQSNGGDAAIANNTNSTPVAIAVTMTDVGAATVNCGIIVDIQKPMKAYVGCRVVRTTQNAVINSIWGILYNADGPKPVTQDATVAASTVQESST